MAASGSRPNILIVLVDDMGFSDIGCTGGEAQTPTIDALARDGVLMTQFYNTARCCPTRASLLTGLHPHQAGIGWMTFQHAYKKDRKDDWPYQGWLNRNCVTIAEVLRTAGYGTYMTGKWHVGTLDKETWPRARGFDRYYGIVNGGCNYFKPKPDKHLALDDTCVEPEGDDFYTTDVFTRYAESFVNEHVDRRPDDPFFLYLAFNAPHWPLQAWPEDIAKYRGKYKIGWDEARRLRRERQIEMGVTKEEWPLSPRDEEVPPWDTLGAEQQNDLDHVMAIYTAMIDRVDQNLKRLVETLKARGVFDNTLILFLSDNGACAEGKPLGHYCREELGTRVSIEGPMTPAYGNCWANVSNTPFRRYKHWVHEGGMGTPVVAHWPVGIPKREGGRITEHYGYLPDFMATCLDATGAEYPTTFEGHDILPHSGKSLLPLITGGDAPIHDEIVCWEHEGNRAARQGKWKLVKVFGGEWELYDLEADRTEMNDLSGEMLEKMKELADAWQAWSKQVGVEPWVPRNRRKKAQKKQ